MTIAYKILVILYLYFGIYSKKEYSKQLGGHIAPDSPLGPIGFLISWVGVIAMLYNWQDFKSENAFSINNISLTCVCLIFLLSYTKFVGLTIYDILFSTRHKVLFFVRFYVVGILIIYCTFKFGK